MDGSKEQKLGKLCHKPVHSQCHLNQTEPYSPQHNATEYSEQIMELRKTLGIRFSLLLKPGGLQE